MQRHAFLPAALLLAPAALAQSTTRVNLAPGGVQTNGDMPFLATISADGRTVAYCSSATNLVAGDTNNLPDVFVHDRLLNQTIRANATSGGTEGNGAACPDNSPISLTPDGLYVAFTSAASNITIGDLNGHVDVFVRHVPTGAMSRISNASGTLQANGPSNLGRNAITDDGRYVVFSSQGTNLVPGDTNGFEDVFWRDRITSTTQRMSLAAGGQEPNQSCNSATISGDGRYVAFASAASNLVAGDTNNARDVFLRDLVLGTIERVSLGAGGVQGNANSSSPTLSADGRWLAFVSSASNLVPGDTYGQDVFARDLSTGSIVRASVNSNEVQAIGGIFGNANPQISRDGRFVVFSSDATNLAAGDTNNTQDVFARDLLLGNTERLSVASDWTGANGASNGVAISGDGRFAVFVSGATNLVAGDTNGWKDVFVRDRQCAVGGETELVSIDAFGGAANGSSTYHAWDPYGERQVSHDGRWIAFESLASDLVIGDTNGVSDVFLRDRTAAVVERVSIGNGGAQANGASLSPSMSADARFVAFMSFASNLVAGDTNGGSDIFVRDRVANTTVRVSVSSAGLQSSGSSRNPSISAGGRFVVFTSLASDLVAGVLDPHGNDDVFWHDLQTGTTELISYAVSSAAAAAGQSDHASVSADGVYVAFQSDAADLVNLDFNTESDVFIRDRSVGATTLVSSNRSTSSAAGYSYGPQISNDGSVVAFLSGSPELVPGDTNARVDVFESEWMASSIQRVSTGPFGAQGDGNALSCAISGDGRFVAFESLATNLVSQDTNGAADVFLRDRDGQTTHRISISTSGAQAVGPSTRPAISGDGRHVAFISAAQLDAPDTNVVPDVYVRRIDVATGCNPDAPLVYCTSGTSTHGCTAAIASTALPSVSFAHGCEITVSGIEGQRLSLIFYGVDNSGFTPSTWGSGTSLLCVKAPTQRSGSQNSGGTAGACDGVFTLDWNTFRTTHPSALGSPFAVGARTYAQAWYRDPPASKTTNLSNAVELTFVP